MPQSNRAGALLKDNAFFQKSENAPLLKFFKRAKIDVLSELSSSVLTFWECSGWEATSTRDKDISLVQQHVGWILKGAPPEGISNHRLNVYADIKAMFEAYPRALADYFNDPNAPQSFA